MLLKLRPNERTVITQPSTTTNPADRGSRDVVFEGSFVDAIKWAHKLKASDLRLCLASFPDRGARPFTAAATALRDVPLYLVDV
ncbi:hypothetical protein GGQ80_002042 [Sphingomonas jinjuensis]|uniref:Uncharacterized protein n=1 Tax=Sphingomonas jinjuensis TaxID=535907 RepID=A0A840FBW2_9SPHN|nr:hypothetical protein [Sphingomonas jinjuensis]MBB4154132.1 hypothetical protein [Sphingomonas jinjuensis]